MFIKKLLRTLCMPVLKNLESGKEPYEYKKSHRVILIIMGLIFSILGTLVLYFAQGQDIGYFIPVIVFGGVGILSIVVGIAGSDRAVSRIWTSKR